MKLQPATEELKERQATEDKLETQYPAARFDLSLASLYPDIVATMQKFIQTSKQQAELPSLFRGCVPTLFLVGAAGVGKSSLLGHVPEIVPEDCVVESLTSETLERLVSVQHTENKLDDSPRKGRVWLFDEPLESAVQLQLLKLPVSSASWCCLIIAVRTMADITAKFSACKVLTMEPFSKHTREMFFQSLVRDTSRLNPHINFVFPSSTPHHTTFYAAVSELTPSFSAQDLVRLWEVALQRALLRIPQTNDHMPDQNGKTSDNRCEVVWDDLLSARGVVVPQSAISDFDFCVPSGGWEQVGGMPLVRKRLSVIARQWEARSQHTRISGVLLHGPSGCGKTLVARAFAGEMKCNFISVSLSDLCSKWLGESEAQIRRLFAQAANLYPCILMLEDLDTIGGDRADITGVDRRMVSTLLNELDGVEARPNLLVMGTTNHAVQDLDSALIRPGRFDDIIEIPFPSAAERLSILKVHTQALHLTAAATQRLSVIAEETDNFTGAELAQLCREAGLNAIREAIRSGRTVVEVNEDDMDCAWRAHSGTICS